MKGGSVKASFCDENGKAVKLPSVTYADGSAKSGVASLTLKDGDRLTDTIRMAAVDGAVKFLKIEAAGTGMNKYSLLA
jgi:VCBS repeat-containing protein